MDSKRISYKYEIKVHFDYMGKPITLPPHLVKNLEIKRDYENNQLPYILLNLTIDIKHKNELIKNKDNEAKNKMSLEIVKYVDQPDKVEDGVNMVVKESVLYKQFTYVLNPEEVPMVARDKDVKEDTEDKENLQSLSLGLMDFDAFNKAKKEINMVIHKSDLKSALLYHLKDFDKLVIEKFNNYDIEQLLVPYMTSIHDYISFMNSYYNIYNSGYIIFHDFDRSYFTSRNHNGIKVKSDKIKTINFEIYEDESPMYKDEIGQYIDNGTILRVNFSKDDNAIITKKSNEKDFGTLVIKGSNNQKSFVVYPKNKNKKTVYINTPNTQIGEILKYNKLLNNTQLVFNKTGLDVSLLTPNMIFNVISKTSGETKRCVLTQKNETYYMDNGSHICTVNLVLKERVE